MQKTQQSIQDRQIFSSVHESGDTSLNKKKKEITELVFNFLKNKYPTCISHDTADHYCGKWWIGGRSTDTMQLTGHGFLAFIKAELEYHKFPVGDTLNLLKTYGARPKIENQINKKIYSPFFVNWRPIHWYSGDAVIAPANTLMIFDDKEAVSIILRGGKLSDILL